MPTPTRQLIEVRLGRDLRSFIGELRAGGMGWRRVAETIRERTDIAVSHETVRGWMVPRQSRRAQDGDAA